MSLRTLAFVSIFALGGCAHTSILESAPQVPGAQGQVSASSGDNGNTKLEVSVKHLAAPGKVMPGATTYVVWGQATATMARAQNLGALTVDSDLKGELDTLTPMKSFTVFVTPELSKTVEAPSGPHVLTAHVQR